MFRFSPVSVLLLLSALLVFAACDRSSVTTTEGALSFAEDTVKFDSIFINFRTPSKRIIAHNNADENLLVSRIWLDKGDSSEFKMIVNGIRRNDVADVVVEGGDSIYLFVELTSMVPDSYVEEYVNFQIGKDVQRVLLRAWVVDAILYRARVTEEGGLTANSNVISENTTFTAAKPYVIDGPLFVLPNVTLTVQPGAKLYFSSYKPQLRLADGSFYYPLISGLFVEGSLNIAGNLTAPVVLTGYRLEDDYREKPGEWRGVIIRQGSVGSVIEHCLIKNGARGVEVNDSTQTSSEIPRLTMRYSEIRNMSETGLLSWSKSAAAGFNPPAVQMENCLIHSCKENTVRIQGGGNYVFNNCTFANYAVNDSFSFLREGAQLQVTNIYEDALGAVAYPIRCQFTNCAIWGDKQDEIAFGKFEQTSNEQFALNFDHCLYRFSAETEEKYVASLGDLGKYFTECIKNSDPKFVEPAVFNYQVQPGSPLMGAGKDLSGAGIFDDLLRRPRTVPMDMGAYESE